MSGTQALPHSTAHPGLYRLNVTGTGLSGAQSAEVTDQARQELEIASAILQAIVQARSSGQSSFTPSEGLQPPAGMTPQDLDAVFQRVLGMNYQGVPGLTDGDRALSLGEWSDAAMALQRDAAGLSSRLAPGQGGGVQYADGHWYINGQTYTLAESFLALRVSSYSAMDLYLSDQMNRTQNNASTARKLVGLLSDLNVTFATRGGSSGSYSVSTDLVAALGQHDLNLANLAQWGAKVAGGGNFAAVAAASASGRDAVSGSEFASLITEAKAVFDSINAENQVSQVRLDSVVNARDNVINGLNQFMKGYAAQQAALGRMVGGA